MEFIIKQILCYSYLALVAALASEADYVFIPEDPASTNWKQNICKKLLQVHNKKSFPYSWFLELMNLSGLEIGVVYAVGDGFFF